jgi:glycosyltransferase involved in cell wall biosynthesis
MNAICAPKVDLSVIIPTMNRGKVLFSTVRQVLAQEGCSFELLIIDQSDDEIACQNRSFLEGVSDVRIRYIRVERKSLPNARNIGICNASARIVLFLDDDVIILRDNFLLSHLSAFVDETVGGATGRSVERIVKPNSGRVACHVSFGGRTIFNLMGQSRQTIGTCKGSNMSFRTAAFQEVGGFDRQTELLFS